MTGVFVASGFGSAPDPEREGFAHRPGDPSVVALLAARFPESEADTIRALCVAALAKQGDDAEVVMAFKASLPDEWVLARYMMFPSVDGPTRILRRGDVGNVVVKAARLFARLTTFIAFMGAARMAWADLTNPARVAELTAFLRQQRGETNGGES